MLLKMCFCVVNIFYVIACISALVLEILDLVRCCFSKKRKRREKALNWMVYHIMSCRKLFPLIVRDSFALALGQLLLLSFFFVCWTMASGCNVTLGLWHTFLCFSDSICSKCVLSMCLISCTGCHILIRF